jgi:hypothetical protein
MYLNIKNIIILLRVNQEDGQKYLAWKYFYNYLSDIFLPILFSMDYALYRKTNLIKYHYKVYKSKAVMYFVYQKALIQTFHTSFLTTK